MHFAKIIELLSIEQIKEQYYLQVTFSLNNKSVFYWSVDDATAKALINVCDFSGKYRYRLSLNTSFNQIENQYTSYITKTYRDESVRIDYPCSLQFVKDLGEIKKCQSISNLDFLSFLSVTLPNPQTEEIDAGTIEVEQEQSAQEYSAMDAHVNKDHADFEESDSLHYEEIPSDDCSIDNEIIDNDGTLSNDNKETEIDDTNDNSKLSDGDSTSITEDENKNLKLLDDVENKTSTGKKKFSLHRISVLIGVIILLSVLVFVNTYFESKPKMHSNEAEEVVETQKHTDSSQTTNGEKETDNANASDEIAPTFKTKDYLVYSIPKGYVALTFNNGPSKYTKAIADILKEHHVGGTFFFIGSNVDKFPDVVQYVHENGFSIGNHTMNYSVMTTLSSEDQQREIESTNKKIEGITKTSVKLFRPPHGVFNDTTRNVLENDKMKLILWNNDPKDFNVEDSNTILDNLQKSENSGSIILLHESQALVDALPKIIDLLKEQDLIVANLQ